MRIFCLILVIFVASCASPNQQPAVVLDQHEDAPPMAVHALIAAVNRGDWVTLRSLVKPGSAANETITSWETSTNNGHAVQVGKLLNVETVAAESKKPYKLYSFALENKDGTVNPHWLQVKVREDHGQPEIMDFWNFGW